MKIIINKIKLYFTSVGYASKIIFAASKKYFISEMALTFLFTLLPYLPMFLWKELINSLTNAMEYGAEPLVKRIWFLVFCYAAVMLTEKLLVTISDFISFKYNDAIQYYLDNLMVYQQFQRLINLHLIHLQIIQHCLLVKLGISK